MKFILPILFTVFILTIGLNAQLCPSPRYNLDIQGYDLYRVYVNDYYSCCDICQKNAQCVGFTYFQDPYGYRICRLKANIFQFCNSYGRYSYIIGARPLSTNSSTSTSTTSTTSTSLPSTVSSTSTSTSTTSTSTTTSTTSSTTSTTSTTTTSTTTTSTTSTTSTSTTTTATKLAFCQVENNVYYVQSTGILASLTLASKEDCCNLCGNNESCQSWNYLIDAKICVLRDSIPVISQALSFPNTVFGIVITR